ARWRAVANQVSKAPITSRAPPGNGRSRRRRKLPQWYVGLSGVVTSRCVPQSVTVLPEAVRMAMSVRQPSEVTCMRSILQQRQVGREVGPLAGRADPAGDGGVAPAERPGGEVEPGVHVDLDDRGRGAAGVAHTLDDLGGGVRRHPHLDRTTGRL